MREPHDHERRPDDVPEAGRPPARAPASTTQQLLALQRSVGNQAVSRILARQTLYRGMQADVPEGTKPLLGNASGFQLGVRPNEGRAGQDGKVQPRTGGTSTSKVRTSVPDFTASNRYAFGSHATEDPKKQAFRWVWSFDDANLPAELTARNDHDDHVSLEPKAPMERGDFESKVQSTQANWTRSDPP
jgi:hypothetical protein